MDISVTAAINVKGVQGTVAYMAPEVFAGERKAYGPKCDLWSLGVICFQLLCGEKPFMNRRDTQIGNWSFGNNFPTTQDQFFAMIGIIRRMGHILEHHPGNIQSQLRQGANANTGAHHFAQTDNAAAFLTSTEGNLPDGGAQSL